MNLAINSCHADYFYVLHSSPIFIVFIGSIPVVSMNFKSVENRFCSDGFVIIQLIWMYSLMLTFPSVSKYGIRQIIEVSRIYFQFI